MFRMPRLTLFLAAALAAVPAPAWAQPGAAQPSRPVDECGKPATPSRPRRSTATPAPSGGGAAAQEPRLLGVPAGPGASGTSATATTQPTPAASSTSAETNQSAVSIAGEGEGQQTQASSTSATASAYAGASCTALAAGLLAAGGEPAAASRSAGRNRDALRLGLDPLGDRMRLGPAASVSVPTAFGVDAGELFFGIAYQGRTRYTEQDDGAAVIGLGVGSRRVVALEAALTTYSTFRGTPFETGGLSLKLHRMLPRQTSIAVGWENAVRWGGSDDDGSLYAAATKLVNLRREPDQPFSTAVFTLGLGNGRFRFEEDDAEGNETVNLFAAAGARVTPHVSLVADWTGQDLNAAASLTPLPRVPVVITVGLADLTGSAGDGARFILSLGYGLALRQTF
jgi:hypothetical protein